MRKMILLTLVALWAVLSPAPVPLSAQQTSLTPDEAFQKVLDYLKIDPGAPLEPGAADAPPVVETLPPARDTWKSQDWTRSGGFVVTGYQVEGWVARVRSDGKTPPRYEVTVVRHDQRFMWTGWVNSSAQVTGQWLDPEPRALSAVETALNMSGEWTRTPLLFDQQLPAQAGFAPALVTVLYQQGPFQIVLWYDSAPEDSLRVLVQGGYGPTALFAVTVDQTLELLNRTAPPDSAGQAAIAGAQRAQTPDGLTALRFFANQVYSCTFLEPVVITNTGLSVTLYQILDRPDECIQYGYNQHFFEVIVILPEELAASESITINGKTIDLK